MSSQQECCICFDELNAKINNCVTQCGHVFCFQCIAKSLSQNNTCPCCRAILAEKPEEEGESVWSEDDSENEDESDQFTDYALQGSRWLFQREEGEEIDPEEEALYNELDDISAREGLGMTMKRKRKIIKSKPQLSDEEVQKALLELEKQPDIKIPSKPSSLFGSISKGFSSLFKKGHQAKYLKYKAKYLALKKFISENKI